jgi:hypothetical protein
MPKLELYNPLDPRGVPEDYLDASKLGNLTGQFPSSYDFAKSFVSPSFSTVGGGNGVTALDDPTYLGFNIRFDIMSPLFNGATTGAPQQPRPGGSDAVAAEPSVHSGTPTHTGGESAVGYLESIGQTTRASYLKAFIQGIREIEIKRPYYFQTIEGVTEAYNKTMDMTPFGGSAEGEGITVGLLEAIDLKMSALFQLYKAACYDVKYRRNIIPINLRYFNCYVDILEIRKFKSVAKATTAGNPNSPENDLTKFVNSNTSTITFRFEECVWDPTASGQVFANVANDGSSSWATSSMKWSYGRCEMESQFSGYDSAIKDQAKLQPTSIDGKTNLQNKLLEKQTFSDIVAGKADAFKDGLIKGATNLAERTINSFTQGLVFGNVFGLRNNLVSAINNPQGLINSLAGAALQELAGDAARGINQSIDDNIFSGQVPPASGDDLSGADNIFGSGPSGPGGGFDGGNIFE